MKTFLFLLVVIILGAGIWYYMSVYKKTAPLSDKPVITDTVVIIRDSIINANTFDTTLSGFYQGMLPCKNCEGVQRTIMFPDDSHFIMEELSWGKGTTAQKITGTWKKLKGTFLFYVNNKVISRYKLVKDSLINIENYQVSIPDSLSKQYVLFKKNTAPENPSWKKRKDEGVDIVGNGADPAWSIEIDNEKFVLFKPSALEKPVIINITMPTITKDSIVYTVVTESGNTLKASLISTFCNDGVSDHLYEYKITVWYKGLLYKGCAVLLNGML
ncbi:MAG: copper resistance protein NlpE N-terminal domain-containing protein [Chitinophagaceae bacterium]